MDRMELLTRIRHGRVELESALVRFDSDDMTRLSLPNGWSIKDVIAHIGFWEQRIATLYEILSGGSVPRNTVVEESLDSLNERVYKENRSLPVDTVQANEAEAYLAILAVAETSPEEDLFDPRRFSWTEGEPFYNWIVVNTYGHYSDHIPDLLAA